MKESKKDGWWRYEGKPDIRRNYELFAILAGVRNYNGITPISEPKGVDENACLEFQNDCKAWGDDGHSASFVTLQEMRNFDQGQEVNDQSHAIRGADGKVKETHRECLGPNSAKCTDRVGKRGLFSTFGDEKSALDLLIAELEEVRVKRSLKDDEVRISFYFDN